MNGPLVVVWRGEDVNEPLVVMWGGEGMNEPLVGRVERGRCE